MRCISLLRTAVLLTVPLAAAPAFAGAAFQVPPGASAFAPPAAAVQLVRGRVVDATGAPIKGARVTATGVARSDQRRTATDERGDFVLSLEPGTYGVAVAAEGFVGALQHLQVSPAPVPQLDFVLQISGVRESVSVTAPADYRAAGISSATRTLTPLRDVPQSVTVITGESIRDQGMMSMADVVRFVPGVSAHQGENNRDDLVIRGNRSSADFFVNGVRDDVPYFRDLYNLDRIEALKGPNAMIFGRGGGGGVINRVVKEAGFRPIREVTVQAGAYAHKRLTADVDQPLSDTMALRVNGMFEDSGSFRRGVELERAAVNPTLTYVPGARTRVTVGYEHLRDTRVADRGITSVDGRPAPVDPATFYGNPKDSQVRARANLTSALVEHRAGGALVRSRTMLAAYDRFYQNFVPGAVTADRSEVILTAYNNASRRTNLFNQTDLTYVASTGALRHTLLAGFEAGRQNTDNFRNSGLFENRTSSILVPFDRPTIDTPVVFRQSATDADNHVVATVAAGFAQDQVEITPRTSAIVGVRLDRFDLRYRNNRTDERLRRVDHLLSPRAGLVFKAARPVSLYASYSVSSLPSSGDQFSSLTVVTQQLKPERFDNYEAGVKWDVRPGLSLTTAVYRLDRTNTRATDPNDPTRIVQTGAQRTNGYELGVDGRITAAWKVSGGYAYQDAYVTSATLAARRGARAGQVPRHAWSMWHQYQVHPRIAAAIGIVHRSDMFATIDDTVELAGYTIADLAAYVTLHKRLRLQAHCENLLDKPYFVNADSNTNISPGRPRSLRIGLVAGF